MATFSTSGNYGLASAYPVSPVAPAHEAVTNTTHHEDGRIIDHITQKHHTVVPTTQMQSVEHTEMVTHMVNEVVAQQVPVTRQVPKQVTSTIQEPRQVTSTIQEPKQVTTTVQEPRQVTTTVQEPKQVTQTVMESKQVTETIMVPQQVTKTIQVPKQVTTTVMQPRQVTNTVMEPRQVTTTVMQPRQVTSTVMEPRQVTNTVMENVHEMTTHHVTVQKPVQHAVKKVTQVPQTVNVVHEHEEVVQHERPRMVARVVHEHAAGGVIHHGQKGVRQVGHHVVEGAAVQTGAYHSAGVISGGLVQAGYPVGYQTIGSVGGVTSGYAVPPVASYPIGASTPAYVPSNPASAPPPLSPLIGSQKQ